MRKRLFSWLMVLGLCLTLLPVSALADDSDFTIEDGVLTKYNGLATDIIIPDGVTTIGSRAFAWSSITSVVIPEGVTAIAEYAFFESHSLVEVSLPDSLMTIGVCAFAECESITDITIPSGVTILTQDSFIDCTGLTAINVVSDNPSYKSENGILFNKSGTTLIIYPAGKKDSIYTIPSSVTFVGTYSFYKCTSLTDVVIPSGVETIAESAFDMCEGLKTVTIPSSVTFICSSAFNNCTGLTSVVIEEGLTSIDEYVFDFCPQLTSITLPKSLVEIGDFAFADCNNLKDVYYGGSQSDRNSISVGEENGYLTDAIWHYNSSVPTTSTPVVIKPRSGFSDVPDSSPFSDAVAWAVSQGITTGVTTNSFEPSTTCTNNHILTFLWRSQGRPTSNGSTDFEKALDWAKSSGVADVVGSVPCTRADAVTYLWRLAGNPQVTSDTSFVDLTEGTEQANAVSWAVSKGITNGTDATHFSPDSICTRGQIVTFLYRAYAD